jgi:hypothetical protein
MPVVTTAAILGAGALGGAVAHALTTRDAVARVILIDPNGSAAAGKALDLQQAGAITGVHTRLQGTSDVARAAGCDVVVVADAFGSSDEAPHGGHLAALGNINGTAPIVFAGGDSCPAVAGGRVRLAHRLGSRRRFVTGRAHLCDPGHRLARGPVRSGRGDAHGAGRAA